MVEIGVRRWHGRTRFFLVAEEADGAEAVEVLALTEHGVIGI